MVKTKIEHSDRNTREFGYGLYVNGLIINEVGTVLGMYASECLKKNATQEAIQAAEKRVRAKALRAWHKEQNN